MCEMAVDVMTEIVIERSRADVARFASDPGNATAWYRNIESVTWVTAPPLRAGSRVTFTARFVGRRLTYTYELRELEPGERVVMSTDDGPFPMETTYTWRDAGDGRTHMTLRNRGEPRGFAGIAAPVLAAAMRRAMTNDLKRLKARLESDGGSRGPR
jgi:hypothetical protein